LKPLNVLFLALAPTAVSKYFSKEEINERIDVLWHVHMNRVDQSKNPNSELGSTKGDYSSRLIEFNEKIQTGA
jgi:hypothetical protein